MKPAGQHTGRPDCPTAERSHRLQRGPERCIRKLEGAATAARTRLNSTGTSDAPTPTHSPDKGKLAVDLLRKPETRRGNETCGPAYRPPWLPDREAVYTYSRGIKGL